jgi:hypothetical protein
MANAVTSSSAAACWIVTSSEFGSGGGTARMPARNRGALDVGAGERQPLPGATALAVEDRRDLVGVVLGEPTDQLDRVFAEDVAVRPAGVELDGQLGARTAVSRDLHAGVSRVSVDSHHDLADQRAQQLPAITIGGCVRGPQPREVARDVRERCPFLGAARIPAPSSLGGPAFRGPPTSVGRANANPSAAGGSVASAARWYARRRRLAVTRSCGHRFRGWPSRGRSLLGESVLGRVRCRQDSVGLDAVSGSELLA